MQLPTTPGETFTVWAKPNSHETAYVRYWPAREAHVIRLSAVADKGKANQELLAYLKEQHGIECEIAAGHASRKKFLKVL